MAQADCPQCGGTGWRMVPANGGDSSAQVAVRCECTAPDRDTRLLERARIPKRYEHCDLSNFDVDIFSSESGGASWDRSLEQARVVVQSFVRNFPHVDEQGLLLMGPCGVGKTHLAVAALKEIVLRGHDGLFYDYRELLKEIQASYNAISQTTEMAVLEPVLKTELLLLDDLGASKPSAWALETVGHILNSRYNEKRVTIITTNYLDGESAQRARAVLPSGDAVVHTEDTLADRVGQRIRSRLYEMCRTVEVFSRDYRKVIRQAGRVRS
jgi:DNA replication protein DnaC